MSDTSYNTLNEYMTRSRPLAFVALLHTFPIMTVFSPKMAFVAETRRSWLITNKVGYILELNTLNILKYIKIIFILFTSKFKTQWDALSKKNIPESERSLTYSQISLLL
jgi:hypothetical protein